MILGFWISRRVGWGVGGGEGVEKEGYDFQNN